MAADLVATTADVAAADVREVARLIGTAKRCLILHARGPEQQTMGTANVLAMINVALAAGLPGRPGSGINMLTGQRNGQGGREWGQRCNQLPAGRSIADPGIAPSSQSAGVSTSTTCRASVRPTSRYCRWPAVARSRDCCRSRTT
ncbi:MAG: molybdopterin-dependent oxidoreductase [Microthrixaceae bacterium]